jgi:CubicO group peptidase (beta-lactamase class C family)
VIDLTAAGRLLDGAVGSGLCTGWQLSAARGGEASHLAGGVDGLGCAVEPTSRFAVYCAIKPLLAVAVGVAVQDGELSWDDRVGHLLPGAGPVVASCTVRSLLDHTSGVRAPGPVEVATLPPDRRLALALADEPLALGIGTSRYAEAAGWLVAGAVLEAAVGVPLRAFTEDRVLEPLGIGADIDLGATPPPDGRAALNVSVRGRGRLPLLVERTEPLGWTGNPGYGGRASTAALVALGAEGLAALDGHGRVLGAATAIELLRPGVARYDETFDRPCSFGAGWMVGLAEHRFGPAVGSRSFGHAGLLGMTACWADPDLGLSAGYHVNGLAEGATMLDWLRPAVVAAVARGAGGGVAPAG